jgi:uncharacterized protein YbjQ (UPF0145 family)
MNPDTTVKFSRAGSPFAEHKLSLVAEAYKAKKILPSDHYWMSGMSEWRLVPELIKQAEMAAEEEAKKASELARQKADAARKEATKSAVIAKRKGLLAVTTTPTVQGYRVMEYIGITRGIIVRTPNILEGIGGSIGKFLGGGQLSAFIGMCEKTRQEAYDAMIADAHAMGANAVVGVSYNANDVMEDCTEVLCYGTAVVLEPEET